MWVGFFDTCNRSVQHSGILKSVFVAFEWLCRASSTRIDEVPNYYSMCSEDGHHSMCVEAVLLKSVANSRSALLRCVLHYFSLVVKLLHFTNFLERHVLGHFLEFPSAQQHELLALLFALCFLQLFLDQ